MNRSSLEKALLRLAAEAGYTPTAGDDGTIQSTVTTYPAARLAPLSVARIEGRRHGRLSYNVTLRLLRLGMKRPPEERAAILARLENDLLDLFGRLSDEPRIIAVEELTLTPAAGTLTTHGELSQTARAQVITYF